MPGIIDILKKRWPEALLIIVVQAGVLFLGEQVRGWIDESWKLDTSVNENVVFATTAGLMFLIVMRLMLELGFMATAYREGSAEQQPTKLIIEGRYYFWRIFHCMILQDVAKFLTLQILIAIGANMFYGDITLDKLPDYYFIICAIVMSLIMAKFILLPQAIIVVDNCNAIDAFKQALQYRLADFKKLLMSFVAVSVFTFIGHTLLAEQDTIGIDASFVSALYFLAVSALMFIIRLTALGYVASTRERPVEERFETVGE